MKYSYRWCDTISVAFKTQTEMNFHHLSEWLTVSHIYEKVVPAFNYALCHEDKRWTVVIALCILHISLVIGE